MTDPAHHSDHHDHHHSHNHDAAHGEVDKFGWSLMRLSAWARLSGAALLLIPLWIAVFWVTAS